ncbi:MAG: DUF3667 domain-containing protein [Cyclobacteriaceae bacterium]|nr:DUF3667 domain-containing protein [Cyclobacteriaceae bacterium]
MNCINCGAEVQGKFCSQCAQPSPPKKLSFGNLYHDFQARIYGFDGMFPRTLKDLTIHPGPASRCFIEGNRVLYYGPVGYFFLMITLMLLIAEILSVDLVAFMKSASETFQTVKPGKGQAQFQKMVLQFSSDNIKLFSFAIIPIQAFVSRYIFFRKSGLTFLEQSVLPFYLQGHMYWLSIFALIYFKISGVYFPNDIMVVMMILYFSYGQMSFFTHQSKVKAFLKGFGVYAVSMIFFTIIVAIVTIIIVINNKEVYDLVKPSNNK